MVVARRVYGSISECITAYVNRSSEYGRAGNVYFDGDVIYSYGSHFPMAVRLPNGLYVCNGDKYSVTTSSHQSQLFGAIPNRERVEIPFSALANLDVNGRGALRVVRELKLLDWQNDQWIDTGRVSEKTGQTIYEHVLGAVLFTYKGQYWLSGLDESGTNGRLFFLTRLSPAQMKKYGKPKTVAAAYELMKPDEVKQAEAAGLEVLRQGEWFFVPAEFSFTLDVKRAEKDYVLKHRQRDREARHHVTEGMRIPSVGHVVRGVVRHGNTHRGQDWRGNPYTWRDRPEHRQLKLYETGTKPKDRPWFLAYESPQVVSFSAIGAVD